MRTLKQLLRDWLEIPKPADLTSDAARLLSSNLSVGNIEKYSFEWYLHATVKEYVNKATTKSFLPEILHEIRSEDFIDSVIKRIKDKQL